MPIETISVVIPTRERVKLLRDLLESLTAERDQNPTVKVEIIVIDDSPEGEAREIKAACLSSEARYLTGPANVRQKRNIGIQHAIHDIVLFIDSDCQATPGLLHAHLKGYESNAIGGVIGETVFTGPDTFMWGVIERTQYLNSFSFASRMEYAPWGPCCNISYRRSVLCELGGFVDCWPLKLGGDDAELGLRVTGSGLKIRCSPTAVVHHSRQTWNSFGKVWERAFRWGRMDYHLYYCLHKERIKLASPRFCTIFTALLIIGALGAPWHTTRIFLAPVWGILALFFQGFLTALEKHEPTPKRIIQEILADLLGLAFEIGTYLESLRHGDLRVFFRNVERGPVQNRFAGREWLLQGWSHWAAIWAVFTLLQFMIL